MALTGKKYSAVHNKTGADKDLLKDKFDEGHINTITDFKEEYPHLVALVYQIQEMQEELDYLRTEISNNKDKATFPGLGTSASTALAGDTTTISTAQASAITANTAKTGITTQEQKDISGNKTNIASNVTAIRSNAVDIANRLTVVPNLLAPANAIQELRVGVSYNLKTNTHELMFTYSETTPKATLRKSGSIPLK